MNEINHVKEGKTSFSWKEKINQILNEPFYLANILGHEQTFIFVLFERYLPKLIKSFKKIREIIFRGNNKSCPCCRGNFRKFLPVGTNRISLTQCPGCNSLERHRLILLYLKNRTDFFSKKLKVLHFAPNKILHTFFMNLSNLEYITADLDSPLAMVKTDIRNLLFDDNSFDVILCSHVLEHVNDDFLAMRELFRVLKPNGWAIIQSPIDYTHKKTFEDPKVVLPEDRRRLYGEEDHLRIYGLDYKDRLIKGGFNVKVDDYVNTLGEKIIYRFGLDKKEKIYYCYKK